MPLPLEMLDDRTLEAATSRGLVRRAHRDLASGTARVTRDEAGEAVIELGDAVVTLRAGGLDAATCTCPSHAICRHILAAIILLRGAHSGSAAQATTDPGNPDPVGEILAYTPAHLARAFGKALLARAEASLPAEVTITTAGATCTVAIEGAPEVRYVAGLGLQGMLCKAAPEEARLLRAQALLAVRRAHDPAHARAPPLEVEVAQPLDPALGGLLDRAGALVIDWVLAGLAAAPRSLQDRLLDGAIAARAGGLFRLSAELRRLSEDVRRRRERDVDLVPMDSLRAASRAFALVEALRRLPDDVLLRGQVRESFDPIGELTLIGCGYEIWKTPAGARGATAHFYAPARGAWYSASLARTAGQDPLFEPHRAVSETAVWGATLESLSASEVSLEGAAVAPSGRLSLSSACRASIRPAQLKRDELARWAASFEEWSALQAFIRRRLAPSLRSARQLSPVAVLLPSRTGRASFDDVTQELLVPLLDRSGQPLLLSVERAHARRLLALEQLLQRKSPEVFFVTIAATGERIRIRPYGVMTAGDSAVVCLDAGSGAAEGGLRGLTDRLRRHVDQRRADRARPSLAAPTATVRLLGAALDLLLGLTELGGHMQDPSTLEKIRTLARGLDAAGLRPAAALLAAVADRSGRQRAQAVLVAVHALNALQDLLRLSRS